MANGGGFSEKCYLPEHIYRDFAFINVADGREAQDEHGEHALDGSWRNVVEAAVVVKIVQKLYNGISFSVKQTLENENDRKICTPDFQNPRNKRSLSVGVVSQYRAQVQFIDELLGIRINPSADFSFGARTFDEMGNVEEDVVIVSTVRSNESGYVGQVNERHLKSLSTRARKCVWIVGNGQTLAKSQSIWQEIVFDAKRRNCFFQAWEDKHLAAVVLDVKRELDELDDLLKHESSYFSGTKWKILFSDDFKKSFIALKTLFTKQMIMKFLLKLGNGWRPKRRCVYFLSKYVKQYRVHGLYLICSTDIYKEANCSVQVLKVWDLLPLVATPNLLAKIENVVSLYSDYYMDRCRKEQHKGDLIVPVTWKIDPNFIKYKNCKDSSSYSMTSEGQNIIGSSNSESLLLMKFYSLSSGTVKHLLTSFDGEEILPFEVSDEESEIIRFPRSAFVIGRSGTGKTIVSVMKLVQREQIHSISLNGYDTGNCNSLNKVRENRAMSKLNGLRQIFVTASSNLCSAVKDYVTQLRRFSIDGETKGHLSEIKMPEGGDSLSIFSDIPDSFNDVSQTHFPLVISLEKFLLMLDGSLPSSFFDRFDDLKVMPVENRTYRSHVSRHLFRRKEVDYECFHAKYWRSFNTKYTKRLDPLLVFTQIISCIKGGSRFQNTSNDGILAEKDYIMLSERREPTLSGDKREIIYKIFLDYERKKKSHGEYDNADLVIDLHRRLRLDRYGGPMIDFVYIDEVQDLTMSQISLFKYICANPTEGFLFSGDTAQTIMKGVNFRFQDITSLFYKEFLDESGKVEIFQMHQNFRTHSGVLNLAQSILELLYYFFPSSVDRLKYEESPVQGEVPMLLVSSDSDVLKTMFGMAGMNGSMSFGAEQVILVRDDQSKKELIDQVGNNALVLTILECKGLEFNDVFLFNFFERSPLQVQWRVLYDFMDFANLQSSSQKFPGFDEDKHRVLCAELKQLYVAITRTRKRLWIYDKTWYAEPLIDYWKKSGVIQMKILSESFVNSVKVVCTPLEWNKRGKELFNVGNYKSSISCFRRSGDEDMENLAKAASLQADGDCNLHRNFQLALKFLSEAAEMYDKIGMVESTVTCLMKMGEYRKAATIFLDKFNNPRFEDAADCFSLANCWSDAAINYAKGSCFLKCMSVCETGNIYELGWRLVCESSCNVAVYDKVKYLKRWISNIVKISAVRRLVESAREFPEDGCCLLLENKCYIELALLERVRGNALCEASYLEKDKDYGRSLKLIVFCIAVQVLSSELNDRPLEISNKQAKLLDKAKYLLQKLPSSINQYICAEVEFLSEGSFTVCSVLQHLKIAQKFKNLAVEYFASRKVLAAYLRFGNERFSDDSVGIFRKENFHLKILFFQGCVSLQMLMFAWNLWSRPILDMLSLISSFSSVNTSKYENSLDLLQKCFAVLRIGELDFYVAYNCKASWLQGETEENLYMVEDKVFLNGIVFRSLAQKHLESEICYFGNMLLQKLKEYLEHSSGKKIFSIQRAVLAVQFSGIVSSLSKYKGESTRENFVESESFLDMAFFPLYYDKCSFSGKSGANCQEKDIAVRAIATIFMKNLAIYRTGASVTKAGWAVVFLFLSRGLIRLLSWEAVSSSKSFATWRKFFENLNEYQSMGFEDSFKKMGFKDASASANAFLDALLPSVPQKQLLLLECIGFIVSSCQIESGWFVTTKSTLSESVFSTEYESFKYALSGFPTTSDMKRSCSHLYDFVLAIVHEILCQTSKERRFRLAKKSEVKAFEFHQYMVMKLVIILGLVCLNSREHFYRVQEIFSDAGGALSVLPCHFLLKFWGVARSHKKRTFRCFSCSFSKALETVGDQLVVIAKGDPNMSFMHLKPYVGTSFD